MNKFRERLTTDRWAVVRTNMTQLELPCQVSTNVIYFNVKIKFDISIFFIPVRIKTSTWVRKHDKGKIDFFLVNGTWNLKVTTFRYDTWYMFHWGPHGKHIVNEIMMMFNCYLDIHGQLWAILQDLSNPILIIAFIQFYTISTRRSQRTS